MAVLTSYDARCPNGCEPPLFSCLTKTGLNFCFGCGEYVRVRQEHERPSANGYPDQMRTSVERERVDGGRSL